MQPQQVEKNPEPKPTPAEVKPADSLTDSELTSDQKEEIARKVRTFVDQFSTPEHKNTAISRSKLPLQTIVKNPSDVQWRTFRKSNSLFKEIVQLNSAAFEQFLEGIGFFKVDSSSFKFQKGAEEGIAGNINTIKEVIEVLTKVQEELAAKKEESIHVQVSLADSEETKQE